MIRASKTWRVISRNGNLQSKEEENDNGMAAEDQIQCDFCTFSSIQFCSGPVIHLYECYKDASCHLRFLQSSERIPGQCGNFFDVPEAILLLYRGGIFSIDCNTLSLTICNTHRERLGLKWRRTKSTCCHPDHNVKSRAKPDRGATPTLCKEYWLQTRRTIPVRSG